MKQQRVATAGISVVMPCLNEEASIGEAVDQARRGLAEAGGVGEVVVVDNGSTDRSAAIAREHGARVVEEAHRGYGAALRKGFASARYDILVMGDADLTYDFTRLRDLVEPIRSGEAAFVIGNRMRNIRPGSMPWLHRKVGNPVLSMALRLMFRHHVVKDAHCGMRAIARDAYERLRCVTTGMEFASEMIVCAIHRGVSMTERDIVYHPRVGASKLRSFQDGWRHLRFLMLHSPTFMLILPGLIVWLAGLLLSVPLAFGAITFRARVVDIHSMIVGGVLNVLSMQLIMVGLLAKAYAHLSGLREDPVIAWLYRQVTFERTLLWVTPLILLGVVISLQVVLQWAFGGFGPLNEARRLFFGALLLINGVQIGTSAYLFSIMALPRHIDRLPPRVEETGIPDL